MPKEAKKVIPLVIAEAKIGVAAAKKELYERYDYLRMPIGMLDFQAAGTLFRSPASVSNNTMIGQYNELLAAGYVIKQFALDQGYVYFLFEKL